MKNKRGNIFLSVSIGMFLFVIMVLVIPFFTDDITQARADLDCTNSTISDGTKLQCMQQDIVIPFWILISCSMLIGFIIGGRV